MGIWKRFFQQNGADVPEHAADMTACTLPAKEDVQAIGNSLLFNASWYRRKYELGEYADAAVHYLTKGWKLGFDPSSLFSTKAYLDDFPDVKAAGVNPLLHFEQTGYAEGRWHDRILAVREAVLAANPECRADMEDGLLRIRITNACNAKCRYCGVRLGFGDEKEHAMDPVWYYEYCKPLYEKISVVLITGGDAFIAKESYSYMRFMCETYPQITLMTESNGIAFDERFQQLACAHLFKTHFSINASSAEIFDRSCWEGPGGDLAFPKLQANIQSYVDLLTREGKLCFAPSASMVINHDNAEDVLDFVRMALRLHSWYICFFFDYTENDMNSDYFGQPEISRPVLRMLMELERLLAGKVLLYFRLWIPSKEAGPLQQEIESVPMTDLRRKYQDIFCLAEGRSMKAEYEQRNSWRRRQGKKELSFATDFSPSVQLAEHGGHTVCFAPWQELDLYPDGRMDFCGWFEKTLNLHDFVQDGSVDWEAALNSFAYMSARKRILHDDFRGCQLCCPMNSCKNPITPVHKYGYDRTLME